MLWLEFTTINTDALLAVDRFTELGLNLILSPVGAVPLSVIASLPVAAAGKGTMSNLGYWTPEPTWTRIGSGVFVMTKLKVNAGEVLEVVVVEDVDGVVVELEVVDDEVDWLEELVELELVVVVFVVVVLAAGEPDSARYAPTPATARTTMTTPARTAVLTPLRRSSFIFGQL